MPIEAYWTDDSKTLIQYNFVAEWSVEEFFTASYNTHDMVRSVDHQVDVLVDLSLSKGNPAQLTMIPNSRIHDLNNNTASNLGFVIVIGAGPMWVSVIDICLLILTEIKARLYILPTEEIAHQFLQERRQDT